MFCAGSEPTKAARWRWLDVVQALSSKPGAEEVSMMGVQALVLPPGGSRCLSTPGYSVNAGLGPHSIKLAKTDGCCHLLMQTMLSEVKMGCVSAVTVEDPDRAINPGQSARIM